MHPKTPTTLTNQKIAAALFCILVSTALLEEHRNATISSGLARTAQVSLKRYKSTRGGGQRIAHVVLVDNRDLESEKSYGYYTMAMWRFYSDIVPDTGLLVYNTSTMCPEGDPGINGFVICEGFNGTRMTPYWLKVLAVLAAMDEANEDDLLLFMDTDMQLINENFTRSIFNIDEIQTFLQSGKSMLVIKEDGSFWSSVTEIFKPDDIGKNVTRLYRAPIVSNFFAVINNEMGRQLMEIWWQSMAHPTKADPSGKGFLWSWPWEQERLTAYYDAAPDLFYAVEQSWVYFSFLHHGPFCCIGFEHKYDIIRSVNETMMHQVRGENMSQWNNSDFEELVYDLYHQIPIRQLSNKEFQPLVEIGPGLELHNLMYFWNASSPPYYSFSNDSSPP